MGLEAEFAEITLLDSALAIVPKVVANLVANFLVAAHHDTLFCNATFAFVHVHARWFAVVEHAVCLAQRIRIIQGAGSVSLPVIGLFVQEKKVGPVSHVKASLCVPWVDPFNVAFREYRRVDRGGMLVDSLAISCNIPPRFAPLRSLFK